MSCAKQHQCVCLTNAPEEREEPERVCKGAPLACTHHLCSQCPFHGHNLLLPPALSLSTGQAGWGSRSGCLTLGVCATVSLRQDIGHHSRAVTSCPSPTWKRRLWSKTELEPKWEDGRQSVMFLSLPKIFYLPNNTAFMGWETFSREELCSRKSELISLCISGCGQNQSSCANMWKVIWWKATAKQAQLRGGIALIHFFSWFWFQKMSVSHDCNNTQSSCYNEGLFM